MTITDSNVASKVIKQTKSEFGTLHLFNDIAVVEFNEGTHIDLSAFRKMLNDIVDYFGTTKPFGIVANRVNSYSVSLMDIKDARQALPNLKAYGIVSYNKATEMNAKIESSICEWKDICFTNLYEGLNTIYKRVKENKSFSFS